MRGLAIAGLCVTVAFWVLLLGTIWTQILVTRRRTSPREPAHSISWIEFVPILVIAVAATIFLNRWQHDLGYLIVGGVHVAMFLVIAAIALHQRAKNIR